MDRWDVSPRAEPVVRAEIDSNPEGVEHRQEQAVQPLRGWSGRCPPTTGSAGALPVAIQIEPLLGVRVRHTVKYDPIKCENTLANL